MEVLIHFLRLMHFYSANYLLLLLLSLLLLFTIVVVYNCRCLHFLLCCHSCRFVYLNVVVLTSFASHECIN